MTLVKSVISMKRQIFLIPSTYFAEFEEKKGSSLRSDNEYSLRKRLKMQETTQYFEKLFFYLQVLDMQSFFKILCHTSKL
jgi:hypothetical protein